MKLRLRKNSIRLRLTQTDVKTFAENGEVEESVEFGPSVDQSFLFALVMDSTVSSLKSVLSNRGIVVSAPDVAATEWANSQSVGMTAEQDLEGGGKLQILVEKDFACLEPRDGSEDMDAFPHPAAVENHVCT